MRPGERLWVRGGNGTGKTSLLRCLAGLDAPLGTPGPAGATLCFQDARDSLIGLTVDGERRLRGMPVVGDRRETTELSTGETMRVALQVTKSPIWLLDEPAEALDAGGVAWLRGEIETNQGAVAFVDHTGQLADLATRTLDLGSLAATRTPIRNPAVTPWHVGPHSFSHGLAILKGPNGCGKSTLLREFALANDVAYLPPRASDLQLEPASGPWIHAPDRHPLQWSGGERQRLALQWVFRKEKPVYVLDEPDKHLDEPGLALLAKELQHRLDDGARILMATHGEWEGETQWM